MVYDKGQLKHLPSDPGVYIMRGKNGRVLYVGKALCIQKRVRQYFFKGGDGRAMISHLIAKVDAIEAIVVANEKEALLLENNLIKQHKPRYNSLLKDDKNFLSIAICPTDSWPKLDLIRHRGLGVRGIKYFGPYTSSRAARASFDLLQKLFPLRQCTDAEFRKRKRPCLLYDIKRCPAPCVGLCSKEDYDSNVKKCLTFLEGKDDSLQKKLEKEMESAAEALAFERAGALLHCLEALKTTSDVQRVHKLGGESCDVLGVFQEGGRALFFVLHVIDGRLEGTSLYNFVDILDDLEALVKAVLFQMSDVQKNVLVPCALNEQKELEALFQTKLSFPQRGEKKALLDLANTNARARFELICAQEKDTHTLLASLQDTLTLENFPYHIAVFDTSHLFGTHPVAAAVVAINGKKDAARSRRYIIEDGSEDIAAMKEVLDRFLKRAAADKALPDLILLDGGKNQLALALDALKKHALSNVDVLALAKEDAHHDKGLRREQLFLPGQKEPIHLPPTSPLLFFLQRLRDEAHTMAIAFHRKKRSEGLFSRKKK